MSRFTRREILRLFSIALPASMVMDCKNQDVFDEERVCVHVFQRGLQVPEPLLMQYGKLPTSRSGKLFQVGVPELMFCTVSRSLLSLFQYFWPVSRGEFQTGRGHMNTRFEKSELNGNQDLTELSAYLANSELMQDDALSSALIFTFNDYTRYFTAQLIDIWQRFPIKEFVLFKDPTLAPYLCDFASLQKGFKRPPP